MFEIEIKRAEDVSKQEDEQLIVVWTEAFASEPRYDEIEWSHSEWRVLGRLDGVIVSHVGVLARDILVGDQSVPVGGLGGVATLPACQGNGYAGQLLDAAAVFMRDTLRLPYALLVCEPYRMAFYGKHGWQPLKAKMYIHQRGERKRYANRVMTMALASDPWPDGEVDLLGNPW